MRVVLNISYDGTLFYGFESQTDKRTVQGELCAALKRLYNEDVNVTASGRTDAGVHALSQIVHYDTPKETATDKITGALNFFLPPDIRVKSAAYVSDDFHARKTAKRKTYRYDIYAAVCDNPLLVNRAYRLPAAPDTDVMKRAAALFEGEHDFSQFRCLGSSAKTSVRTVYNCSVGVAEAYGEKIIRLSVTANGFLYKMVRLIAGAVIKAGQGKLSLNDLTAYLNGETEYSAKTPAPACGLYLESVEYI